MQVVFICRWSLEQVRLYRETWRGWGVEVGEVAPQSERSPL